MLDKVIASTIGNLETLAARYERELSDPTIGRLHRAAVTGAALQNLRAMFNRPIRDLLMSLMNSKLGFMTDHATPRAKDQTPYEEEAVVNCAIEALLHGVMWTNNEFNILAGGCYVTQNGYDRKVRETPGLTDLVESPGIPRIDSGKTVVRYGVSWKYKGIPDQLQDAKGEPGRVFEIVTHGNMQPDYILGKARRKALKAVYQQIHGSAHTLPDGEIDDVTGKARAPVNMTPGRQSLRTGAAPAQPEANGKASPEASPETGSQSESDELELTRQQLNAECARVGIADNPVEVQGLLKIVGAKAIISARADQLQKMLDLLRERATVGEESQPEPAGALFDEQPQGEPF